MAEDEVKFEDLMEQVKQGSETAIQQLLDRYGEHIYRVIRRRLNRRLRTQFDSHDFAQAVWASFFARRDEIVGRFESPDDLVAFLQAVAGNKVIDECRRRLGSLKYDLKREQEFGDRFSALDNQKVFSNEQTPSEIISHKEQINRITDNQPSYYQRLVELRLEGVSVKEIAELTGRNERTIRRVLKRLGHRLTDEDTD